MKNIAAEKQKKCLVAKVLKGNFSLIPVMSINFGIIYIKFQRLIRKMEKKSHLVELNFHLYREVSTAK